MMFDFTALPTAERYKLLVSTVVPRPIAWVVTCDANGATNAAPYSFFNAFSAEPPILGVSVGGSPRGPGEKDTLANIRATGQFVVCLVPETAAAAMNVTAIDMPPGVDELAEAGLTPLPSSQVAPPRIAESPVAFECVLHQFVPLGGNELVLGRVLALHLRDDCVLDPVRHHVDTPRLGLLGRMHGGGFYTRTGDIVEVPRIRLAEWQARRASATPE